MYLPPHKKGPAKIAPETFRQEIHHIPNYGGANGYWSLHHIHIVPTFTRGVGVCGMQEATAVNLSESLVRPLLCLEISAACRGVLIII